MEGHTCEAGKTPGMGLAEGHFAVLTLHSKAVPIACRFLPLLLWASQKASSMSIGGSWPRSWLGGSWAASLYSCCLLLPIGKVRQLCTAPFVSCKLLEDVVGDRQHTLLHVTARLGLMPQSRFQPRLLACCKLSQATISIDHHHQAASTH